MMTLMVTVFIKGDRHYPSHYVGIMNLILLYRLNDISMEMSLGPLKCHLPEHPRGRCWAEGQSRCAAIFQAQRVIISIGFIQYFISQYS